MYLKTAYDYIKEKKIDGIRISTRPDYIDKHTLKRLKKYKVKTIELGVQSTNDYVLELSKDVPWLVIDDDMKANVEKKLAAVSDIDDSRTYGECRFKEFYGENATARVSDWINKRNQRIINILRKKFIRMYLMRCISLKKI